MSAAQKCLMNKQMDIRTNQQFLDKWSLMNPFLYLPQQTLKFLKYVDYVSNDEYPSTLYSVCPSSSVQSKFSINIC